MQRVDVHNFAPGLLLVAAAPNYTFPKPSMVTTSSRDTTTEYQCGAQLPKVTLGMFAPIRALQIWPEPVTYMHTNTSTVTHCTEVPTPRGLPTSLPAYTRYA